MKKKVLFVQPIYSVCVRGMLSCFCVVACFFPTILQWSNTSIIICFFYYSLFAFLGCCFFYSMLNSFQLAFLSEKGLIVRNIFKVILSFHWLDVVSIEKKSLLTYNNKAHIYLHWIVISTKNGQIAKKGGINRREEPCQLIASKRNIEFLKYFSKFCTNCRCFL